MDIVFVTSHVLHLKGLWLSSVRFGETITNGYELLDLFNYIE